MEAFCHRKLVLFQVRHRLRRIMTFLFSACSCSLQNLFMRWLMWLMCKMAMDMKTQTNWTSCRITGYTLEITRTTHKIPHALAGLFSKQTILLAMFSIGMLMIKTKILMAKVEEWYGLMAKKTGAISKASLFTLKLTWATYPASLMKCLSAILASTVQNMWEM